MPRPQLIEVSLSRSLELGCILLHSTLHELGRARERLGALTNQKISVRFAGLIVVQRSRLSVSITCKESGQGIRT